MTCVVSGPPLVGSGGYQSLAICIKHSPVSVEDLDKEVDTFINEVESTIIELSKDDFSSHKKSLEKFFRSPPPTPSEQNGKLWEEIKSAGTYDKPQFDRNDRSADQLKSITQRDVVDFYQHFLGPRAERVKSTIHYSDKGSDKHIKRNVNNRPKTV